MKFDRSNKIAYIYDNNKISYSKVIDSIESFNKKISSPKGSNIGILMENRPEWIYSFYAIWDHKSINVPLDHTNDIDSIHNILIDAEIKEIFCSNSTKSLVEEINRKHNSDIVAIISEDIEILKTDIGKKVYISSSNNLSTILYTSGTSNDPVGVMLSKKNFSSNVLSLSEIDQITDEDIMYTFSPLYHSAGLISQALLAPYLGCTVVLSDRLGSTEILNNLVNNRVTIFGIVPKFAYLIHKEIINKINKNIFLRSLFYISKKLNNIHISKIIFRSIYKKFGGHIKYIICGAASLDPIIQRDLKALGLDIYLSYGLTEASPIISASQPKMNKIGSVGKAIPEVEILIKNNEILVKGDNVFLGYYKNSEKTKSTLVNDYLLTGDLGYLDEKGYLYITGRKKELIVLPNGKNIWPHKIEDELVKNNIIEEVAVIEKDGYLNAIVVPNKETAKNMKISNIFEYIKNIVSDYNIYKKDYEKIKKIEIFKDKLPRTKLGKLKRYMLKNLDTITKNNNNLETKYLDNKDYLSLKDFFSNKLSKEIYPNQHIELDLSLDSLEKIELIDFIRSELKVDFNISKLAENPHIEDIIEYISNNRNSLIIKKIDINKNNLKKNPVFWKVLIFLIKRYFKISILREYSIPNPSILVANHTSMLDWYLLASILNKNTYCLAKDKLIRTPLSKWIAKRSNLLIFNLDQNTQDIIFEIKEHIKLGHNIVIFPEGTRSRSNEILEFKSTFAIIAKEMGIPVVPISIKGAFDSLPPGSLWPKKRDIEISIGKSIEIKDDPKIEAKRVENIIRDMCNK
jgi:long-chain acyl-CoA synthetase